jgi:lauroyl/myristoyl acyltransferase
MIEPVRARPSPGDVARWLFWDPFRKVLQPERPEALRLLRKLWLVQYKLASGHHALMVDELRRCFGSVFSTHGYGAIVADAYERALRVHLEELLLGKLDRSSIERYQRFVSADERSESANDRFGSGLANLDQALSAGRGAIWLYPHAGAVMLMLAGLVHRGYSYTQFAARGLAPPEVAGNAPERMGTNWFRERVRQVREANEDKVAAHYLDQGTPVRALHRTLAKGEIVGIAYDGRLGQGFAPFPYLGRTALLSPGPFKLAVQTGAPIVPAFCRTPSDDVALCEIATPIAPGTDWRALAAEVLSRMERWIRRYPEEYGLWLLHCRERSAADDHPLFLDYAPDERWRRWAPQRG